MVEGWEGKNIKLVGLNFEKHFENICRWINDPEISANLIVGDFPLSQSSQKEWFNHTLQEQKERKSLILAIELLNGTHIGMSGIHNIDWPNGYASTGSFIGEKQEQNKGYGTENAKLRAWLCFHVLGLRLLRTEYFSGNDRSKKMQEKAGYISAGKMPERFYKRGRYVDDTTMILTKERWLELSKGERSW